MQFNTEVFDPGMLNLRCSVSKKGHPENFQPSNVFNLSDSSDYETEEEVEEKFTFSISRLLSRKKTEKGLHTPQSSNSSITSEVSISGAEIVLEKEAPILKKSSSKDSLSEFFDGFKAIGRSASVEGSKFKDLLMPPSMQRRGSSTSDVSSEKSSISRTSSELSVEEKYGSIESMLGKGSYATVKLCSLNKSATKFAVKEFRKRRREETMKDYIKKINAEFCIASSLDHENVVKSVDLIQDNHKNWCVVMEYCPGGDLYHRINSGTLIDQNEMNCYMTQLFRGVSYIHSMGVAHRDLKPENILLDARGELLKITDFGVSTVFKSPFGTIREKRKGVTGSGPYIAPEEFICEEYDSEQVDVWSLGIITFVMNSNSIPWRSAQTSDVRYLMYLENKKFAPFERLQFNVRFLIYRMLKIDPTERTTIKALLEDDFVKSLDVCGNGKSAKDHSHHCLLKSKDQR